MGSGTRRTRALGSFACGTLQQVEDRRIGVAEHRRPAEIRQLSQAATSKVVEDHAFEAAVVQRERGAIGAEAVARFGTDTAGQPPHGGAGAGVLKYGPLDRLHASQAGLRNVAQVHRVQPRCVPRLRVPPVDRQRHVGPRRSHPGNQVVVAVEVHCARVLPRDHRQSGGGVPIPVRPVGRPRGRRTSHERAGERGERRLLTITRDGGHAGDAGPRADHPARRRGAVVEKANALPGHCPAQKAASQACDGREGS